MTHHPTPQRVIVTAGASGIGLAIAQTFLSAGARVFVCDVSAQALAAAIAANPGLQGAVADVGEVGQVETFFKQALAQLGGVDVLVNNAGIGGPRGAIEALDYDEWDHCIRVNLSSMFYCTRQVVPAMKAQGGGCIINLSTSSAKTGLPLRLPYVASKCGVLGLSHNLARELGPYNIRCNSILPGLIDNPRGRLLARKLGESMGGGEAEGEQEYLKYISLRCWIDPVEIGRAALFLASDAGRHITAQEIAIDGNVEWEQ